MVLVDVSALVGVVFRSDRLQLSITSVTYQRRSAQTILAMGDSRANAASQVPFCRIVAQRWRIREERLGDLFFYSSGGELLAGEWDFIECGSFGPNNLRASFVPVAFRHGIV
jgi:hypothetical protein